MKIVIDNEQKNQKNSPKYCDYCVIMPMYLELKLRYFPIIMDEMVPVNWLHAEQHRLYNHDQPLDWFFFHSLSSEFSSHFLSFFVVVVVVVFDDVVINWCACCSNRLHSHIILFFVLSSCVCLLNSRVEKLLSTEYSMKHSISNFLIKFVFFSSYISPAKGEKKKRTNERNEWNMLKKK